jgi:hypothetical protein
MPSKEIKVGDYVVATKYSDGDSKDHWCIGFYNGRMLDYGEERPRYDVVDGEGVSFRGNGFRRVKKISKERGKAILDVRYAIEHLDRSVWFWVRTKLSDFEEIAELNRILIKNKSNRSLWE